MLHVDNLKLTPSEINIIREVITIIRFFESMWVNPARVTGSDSISGALRVFVEVVSDAAVVEVTSTTHQYTYNLNVNPTSTHGHKVILAIDAILFHMELNEFTTSTAVERLEIIRTLIYPSTPPDTVDTQTYLSYESFDVRKLNPSPIKLSKEISK